MFFFVPYVYSRSLISRLPPSPVISAVGKTLSNTPTSLPYARRASTFILGRQLIRPEGLRGLCESVFAEEDVSGDDAPLEKLEHVARVLNTVPAGMTAEASSYARCQTTNLYRHNMALGVWQDYRSTDPAVAELGWPGSAHYPSSSDCIFALSYAYEL